MSLYPGNTAYNALENKYYWDEAKLANSMAKEIEKELEIIYLQIKGIPIKPVMIDGKDVGKEDRNLLFVAISRGILKYLKDNESKFITTMTAGGFGGAVTQLTLDINIDNP